MASLMLTTSFFILIIAFSLVLLRFFLGPQSTDRILCLDLLAIVAAGLISIHSVQVSEIAFLDIVLILSIIGFISTIVFARYIESGKP